jgi:hypothetical protein
VKTLVARFPHEEKVSNAGGENGNCKRKAAAGLSVTPPGRDFCGPRNIKVAAQIEPKCRQRT